MKLTLLLISLFGQIFVFAQSSSKTMSAWDSLSSRTTEEIKRFEDIARKRAVYIDTSRKDGSMITTYSDSQKNKLKVISNHFNSNNCLIAIDSGYYNCRGLLAFRKVFKKCCPEETFDNYKCFERTTYYERFEYDNKNRIIVHLYHVTTPETYKETLTYTSEGTQQIQ